MDSIFDSVFDSATFQPGIPVIRGEEIFLNYSYNMNNNLPKWYVMFYEEVYGKLTK